MPCFLISPDQVHGDRVRITGSDVHHIVHVLRKQAGDLVDGLLAPHTRLRMRVLEASPEEVVAQVVARETFMPSLPMRLVLFQGLVRGPKMDLIVQKATELGVASVVPVVAERSVPRVGSARGVAPRASGGSRARPAHGSARGGEAPGQAGAPAPGRATGVRAQARHLPAGLPAAPFACRAAGEGDRVARWERIAREACKQCGRPEPPQVFPPRPIAEVGTMIGGLDVAFVFTLRGCARPISELMPARTPEQVGALIGPEGGFSEVEEEMLVGAGAVPLRLPGYVLRAETAAIAACALLMHCLRQMSDA